MEDGFWGSKSSVDQGNWNWSSQEMKTDSNHLVDFLIVELIESVTCCLMQLYAFLLGVILRQNEGNEVYKCLFYVAVIDLNEWKIFVFYLLEAFQQMQ